MSWKWYASADEESYTVGPCDSREQVIAQAISDEIGISRDFKSSRFHIMEARQDPIDFAEFVNEESLFEEMVERAEEDHLHPDGDGDAIRGGFTDSHVQALGNAVRAAVRQWQIDQKINVTPTNFNDTRNGEWVDHVREPA